MRREATTRVGETGCSIRADPVDEHLGHFTTWSSRFFIQAAGLNFGDGLIGDTGELGGVLTLIGIEELTSGEPFSLNWLG